MAPRKNVTEEDVKATEARISGSYSRLKRAIMDIPSEAARPVTDTVRSHPYASLAAASCTGFLAYRLLSLFLPKTKIITREISIQPEVEIKEKGRRSFVSRLMSEAVALALPYLTGYMQREVSRLLLKPREVEPAE